MKWPEKVLVNDEFTMDQMVRDLSDSEVIGIDTETTGLNHHADGFDIVGVCLAKDSSRGYYTPVGHTIPPDLELFPIPPKQLSRSLVLEWLLSFCKDRKVVMHNAGFDIQVFWTLGIDIEVYFDTMIAAAVMRRRGMRLGLKDLAKMLHIMDAEVRGLDLIKVREEINRELMTIDQVTQGHPEQFAWLVPEEAAEYAAADAANTMLLYEYFSKQIEEADTLRQNLFWNIEMPLVRTVARMEDRGILVDDSVIHKAKVKAEADSTDSSKKIYKLAGKDLKLNSGPEMMDFVYGTLKYPVLKNQRGEAEFKLDARMLKRLLREKPQARKYKESGPVILEELLKYRAAAKIMGTYTNRILKAIMPDGRIHASFMQVQALSGRMASSNPNMQNLPTLTGDMDIRRAFVADPGFVFVLSDYCTAEMVVVAGLADDSNMKKMLAEADIHKYTASVAYDIPMDKVTDKQRKAAKTVGFGILYGRGAFDLATDLGIKLKEAKVLIDSFYEAYPKVKEFVDMMEHFVESRGYSVTMWGRRRHFWDGALPNSVRLARHLDITESDARALLQEWKREGRNHPIQGTVSDAIKISMWEIDQELHTVDPDARLVSQVHDEIVTLCREERAKEVAAFVEAKMAKDIRGMGLVADSEIKYSLTKKEE